MNYISRWNVDEGMTKAPTPGVDPDDPELTLTIAVVLPELARLQKVILPKTVV